jgi:hypothetical protein
MSNVTLTYEQHAAGPCPWLPDQTFGKQNAPAIRDVMAEVATDYSHVAATVDFDPTVLPPDEQRAALWKLLMGRQHGLQEQSDGKVTIADERLAVYHRKLGAIAIGPHPMLGEAPVDPNEHYDQGLLTGGTPIENVARLRSSTGENIAEVVALTGQRVRGMWADIPGEGSVEDLMRVTGEETGADMADVTARSPFVQAELQRTGEAWEAPFGTEYHMYRLAVEAMYADQIDWDHYHETVIVQQPVGPNEEMQYYDGDRMVTVLPREEGAVTYSLKNGRKIHLVNGAAAPRPYGMPRATSSSIAQEAMNYVPIPDGARLVAVSAAPHLRAAMDTIITYLDEARRASVRIERADVAAGPHETRITHLVAALGEIMATMKADFRLRAVLRGEDPNAKELLAI